MPRRPGVLPDHKLCASCGADKPIDEFYLVKPSRGHRKYPTARCKPCHKDYVAGHRYNTGDFRWAGRVRRQYGITRDVYAKMLKRQKGVCEICRRPETEQYLDIVKRLAVDHDHRTGQLRGLLCARCNGLLGRAQDDPELLMAAARYLRKYLRKNRAVAEELEQSLREWMTEDEDAEPESD